MISTRQIRLILLLAFVPQSGAFLSPKSVAGPAISRTKVCSTNKSDDLEVNRHISRRRVLESTFSVAASGLLLPHSALADETLSAPSRPKVTVPSVRLGGGKSSLKVSRTIQGYWQLAGGHGNYREVDAIDNMQAHFNAGITTLDTADIYGPSELIVGKFVQSQPGAIPCTKFCCFRYLEVSCCAL